ncbi:hypothetical protein SLE2022_095580 [Rubroshorea leprosula]
MENSGKGTPWNGNIYVSNLPPGTDEILLAEYFGTIGLLKKISKLADQRYVEWFNGKDFHGSTIGVATAESKNGNAVEDPNVTGDLGGLEENSRDMNGVVGRGRGRGDGKAWQQVGDWSCPNTSCSNVNFAFRGVCNRCGTARPTGAFGSGGAGDRGRGHGAPDPQCKGRAVAASGGLFGPNDWPNNPHHLGGRGGGYKELDEEEIEETRRRQKEAEEDDGEMYDEFGNLKKKFRAKTQAAEAGKAGSGRAGWEVEELGAIERDGREKGRDTGREWDDRESNRSRERDHQERRRSQSRERDRGKDRDCDYDYDRDRDYGRERDHDQDRSRYRY